MRCICPEAWNLILPKVCMIFPMWTLENNPPLAGGKKKPRHHGGIPIVASDANRMGHCGCLFFAEFENYILLETCMWLFVCKKRWWPLDMGPWKVNKLTGADPNQRHYLLALETCVFKTLIMGPPLSAAAFEHIDVSHEKCTPWIFIAPWWSHDSWLPTDVLRLLAVRFGPGAGLIKNFKRGEGNPRVSFRPLTQLVRICVPSLQYVPEPRPHNVELAKPSTC